jgi:hypothetical protein
MRQPDKQAVQSAEEPVRDIRRAMLIDQRFRRRP